MEGFNEQVVKRVNKAKQLVIKIISVVVLIMIPSGDYDAYPVHLYDQHFSFHGRHLRSLVCFLAAEGRV